MAVPNTPNLLAIFSVAKTVDTYDTDDLTLKDFDKFLDFFIAEEADLYLL